MSQPFPNKPEEFTLNSDQQAIADAVAAGDNVCFTGQAGTGKSYLLAYLRTKYRGRISITATTGIAALNVSGCTIHSWAGLGTGTDTASVIAGRIISKKGTQWMSICTAERLAIDEISMMDSRLLTLLSDVLSKVRRTPRPFGGIQMLFIGDYLQLPPVRKQIPDDPDGPPPLPDDGKRFAFHAPEWDACQVKVMHLTQNMRQREGSFASVLEKVRLGTVDRDVHETLHSRLLAVDPDPSIRPVILHSYNKSVDAINAKELAKLEGEEVTYTAADQGIPQFIDFLDKNCTAPKLLALRVGAQVMLLKNLDTANGLVNGSIGRVVGFGNGDHRYPLVHFANGTEMEMEPEKWELKRDEETLAERSQVPLRLAWAITVHKCQGMTLDKVQADLGSVFEYGQAYVALSRVRTLEGLFLTALDTKKIKADPDALAFYGYTIPSVPAHEAPARSISRPPAASPIPALPPPVENAPKTAPRPAPAPAQAGGDHEFSFGIF